MIGTLLLNRYEILEKIGEGGMGTVYKGRCIILDTFVAIKIIKSELNKSKSFIARFHREANLIASLSHPNIVKFYAVGSKDNINFLVMEYVDGKSLSDIIDEKGRLGAESSLNIAMQVARALEVAHKNNIIHRDIKPDNILITKSNKVKLMDFGLAKGNDSLHMTSANLIIGTVQYFSPEQANGNEVDCRTDIYALGIVMYEMVTGQLPFDGDNPMTVILKHANNPVIPPGDLVSDLPKYFNRVILKSLEKRPVDRFQTATELFEALTIVKNSLKEKHYIPMNHTAFIKPNTSSTSSNTKRRETIIISKENLEENYDYVKEDSQKNSWINENPKVLVFIGLAVLIYIFIMGVSN